MKNLKTLFFFIIFVLFSCKTDDEPVELPNDTDRVLLKINNQNWEGKAKYAAGVDITAYTDLYGSETNPEFRLHIAQSLVKEGQTISIMGQNAVTYVSYRYNNKDYHSYNGPAAINIGTITFTKTGERLIGSFQTKIYGSTGGEYEITNGYFNVKINKI